MSDVTRGKSSGRTLTGVGVDESQSVAGELLDVGDAIAYIRFHGTFRYVLESVRAGLLVGECGAHPRLHVAHLEEEGSGALAGGANLPHLLQRPADFVHGVAQVREAVVHRHRRARAARAIVGVTREVGDVGRHAVGLGEADADGHARQLAGVLLHRIGVAGEGGEAHVRV